MEECYFAISDAVQIKGYMIYKIKVFSVGQVFYDFQYLFIYIHLMKNEIIFVKKKKNVNMIKIKYEQV